jgi:hypothetical protein
MEMFSTHGSSDSRAESSSEGGGEKQSGISASLIIENRYHGILQDGRYPFPCPSLERVRRQEFCVLNFRINFDRFIVGFGSAGWHWCLLLLIRTCSTFAMIPQFEGFRF